ncbi:lysine--tRNA ligase, cytoplasmic-like [Primulina tabacum]|uniref:lysine--tRNA ligase, cytoplasmic-like n=1 Tax=Primulina tabacum TaxID=48773 RepID=UPI003F59A8CE
MQKASAKPEQQAKKPAAAEDEGMDPTMFHLEGRLMNKGSSSSKLFFYDLHGDGAKVQVMADARQLYLDLMLNMEVLEIFKTRSKVISYIRSFLDKLDFSGG